jgi:hypothetical protein
MIILFLRHDSFLQVLSADYSLQITQVEVGGNLVDL